MIIFRSKLGTWLAVTALSGCGINVPPSADACPDQPLSSSLSLYDKDGSAKRLTDCLTENALKLSAAAGAHAEVAQAATTACQIPLGLLEVEAGLQRFERGDMKIDAGAAEVRAGAERYALARVVQARAGECTKK